MCFSEIVQYSTVEQSDCLEVRPRIDITITCHAVAWYQVEMASFDNTNGISR